MANPFGSIVTGALRGAGAALGAFVDAIDPVSKASGPNEGAERAPGGSQADNATNAPMPTDKAVDPPQSLMFDPFTVLEQIGYKDKPSQITYGTLRAIVQRSPVIAAVMNARINQVASFSVPQQNRHDLGFRIGMRNPLDKPSPADRKFIDAAKVYFQRTGVTDNPRGRDKLETYVRKVARDMLMFDQNCTEIVPNRAGQPAEFYAVDASSIRLADTARLYMDEDVDDAVRYVQVYDNAIIAQYTQEEMCFGIRNPQTDMRLYGYGTSELEWLMNAITSLLFAWEYNQKFFSQGSAAKGIINIKGTIPDKQLNAFKRHWYAMVSGIENAWKTPILSAGQDSEVQWINMQSSNRDMEFNAWMDFLIKVCCAAYLMDPSEINFKYGNTGQSSTMSEESNRDKLADSRERGLRPILRHIADNFNQFVLWPINEAFVFEFVGLDSMTRQDMAKFNESRVKTTRTIDELRAEEDLPPLPDGQGAIILDPTFIAAKNAADQAAAQKQMMDQYGMQGDPQGDQGDQAQSDEDEHDADDAKGLKAPKGGPPPGQRRLRAVGALERNEDDGDVEKSLTRRANTYTLDITL